MIKKLGKILIGLFFALWGIYLLLPPPAILPPLPESLKSIEPGDTVQIPGISAYYTNLSRQEVISFYQENFSRSTFLKIPLPTYRLNHPPEFARTLIRSTQQSSYIEEIVHPLRESLYVNGFEWENDPFTKPEKRIKNKMIIDKKEYKAKITLIIQDSYPIFRIITSFILVFLGVWLMREAREIYRETFKKGLPLRLPKVFSRKK